MPTPQKHFRQANFGIKLQPAIGTVLLASLREREHLVASRRKAHEKIERMRAELSRDDAEQSEQKKPRWKKAAKQGEERHAEPAADVVE